MIARARVPMAGAALTGAALVAALVVGVSGSSAVGDKSTPLIAHAVFAGPAQAPLTGVMSVVQPTARPRGRAVVSLHGLPAGTYDAAGVTAPCSVDLDEEGVAAATSWEVEDFSVGVAGDVFVTRSVALRRKVGRIRSMRIYSAKPGEGFAQLGCARSFVFVGGGAATGAAVGR